MSKKSLGGRLFKPQTISETRRIEETKKIENNKESLFSYLKEAEIQSVSLPFFGQHETGTMETPTFTSLQKKSAPEFFSHWLKKSLISDQGFPNPTYREGTVKEVVNELGFDLLNRSYPGWELGAGAEGTITFYPFTGEIKIALTEYSLGEKSYHKEL